MVSEIATKPEDGWQLIFKFFSTRCTSLQGRRLQFMDLKTTFKSKDLWNIVKKGFAEEGDNNRLAEVVKKDAKALCLIQQNLDKRVLLRITEATIAKQAWDVLKPQYQGNTNNVSVKFHSLHQELDATKMKHGERIEDHITRVLNIVYQIKVLG